MKKLNILLAFILVLALLLTACASPAKPAESSSQAASSEQASPSVSQTASEETKESDAQTVQFTDFSGNVVTIPAHANKIAALVGPSFEKTLVLGQADRVAVSMKLGKWAQEVYPAAKNLKTVENPQEPNVEELASLGVDLVFFWQTPEQIKKMSDLGIPALSMNSFEAKWSSIDEFVEISKKDIQLYGDALGSDAQAKAEKWVQYFDEKVKYVLSRTSKLTKDQIKKVYYIRSSASDGLEAFLNDSTPHGLVEIAGGDFVTKDAEGKNNYGTVTMEQVIKWNPDVIFLGRVDSTDLITKNSQWDSINAVKNGQIYLVPNGVFMWDNSSERVLNLLFLAKTLHPELFEDLDMVSEIQQYYSTFYNYDLSAENAQRIIDRLPPA